MTVKAIGSTGFEFPDSTVQSTKSGASANKTRFSAYKSTTTSANTNGTTVAIYDTVDWQTGSGYNSSTGVFTAPVAGYYLFVATLSITASSGLSQPYLFGVVNRGGTSTTYSGQQCAPISTTVGKSVAFTGIVKLAVGDTFDISAYSNGGSGFQYVGSSTDSRFAGHLLSTY